MWTLSRIKLYGLIGFWWIGKYRLGTAGVMKTVPSVNTLLLNTFSLSHSNSWWNSFLYGRNAYMYVYIQREEVIGHFGKGQTIECYIGLGERWYLEGICPLANRYIKIDIFYQTLCYMVWFTPFTLIPCHFWTFYCCLLGA